MPLLTSAHPSGTFRPAAVLTATRVSRCVRERLDAGGRAVVRGVQRRACHLALDDGALLILSPRGVPLAPNGFAVDLGLHATPAAVGLSVGQSVSLGLGARPGGPADWWVELGAGATWEPRPRVAGLPRPDLADRLRTTRAIAIAEGARESLLPLLWLAESDRGGSPAGMLRATAPGARRLVAAAVQRDGASVGRAAGRLAGLGSGLTPSGDDFLAGFAAAWALVGAAVGLDAAARRLVTGALGAGARTGASPIGRAWLDHACRGELLEPMTGFASVLLAEAPVDLGPAVRGALAVGSSSGTDWMVGFVLGSGAVVEATRRDPSW